MTRWIWMALAIAGWTFGCSDTSGGGSSGGDGSDSHPNASTGDEPSATGPSDTASSSSKPDASTTGSTASCDEGDCGKCAQCAQKGSCSEPVNDCNGNDECVALYDCLSKCTDDKSCFDNCVSAHPNGQTDLATLLKCVVCDACPSTCDTSSSCG